MGDFPRHFELFEHVHELFTGKSLIVEDFTLLDDACHWQEDVGSLDFAKVDISLTSFTDLTMVDDVEFLC